MSDTTAFPLCWPAGWPRTKSRSARRFKGNTFARARDRLVKELRMLSARRVVLSTNVPLKDDGMPRAGGPDLLPDPGVAVYFVLKERHYAMARDEFRSTSENMRSLALAIEHMRGMHRHGGAHMVERVFTGFVALPAPGPRKRPWREVLDIAPDQRVYEDDLVIRFKNMARKLHPDVGGSTEAMVELNQAYEDARAALGL